MFVVCRRQLRAPPFPYTTLFRSERSADRCTETTPECSSRRRRYTPANVPGDGRDVVTATGRAVNALATSAGRSEEHTSELQSLRHLVCRLLLEKKKKQQHNK